MKIIDESFEGAASGVAVSPTNSTINGILTTTGVGSAIFSNAFAVSGTRSCLISVDATADYAVYWDVASLTGSQYASFYPRLPAVAPATIQVIARWTSSANVNRCQIAMNTSGKLLLRNVSALVATSTGTYHGTRPRLEWDVVGTTQTLRIFSGANLHGTTPDETITGAFTSAAATRFAAGFFGAWGAAASIAFDAVRVSDSSNPGPLVSNVRPVAYWFNGTTLVPLATPVLTP